MQRFARYLTHRVRSFFVILRAIVGAIRLVMDPDRLADVFVLDRAVSTPKVLARIGARLRSHPQTSAALALRRPFPRLDLDALATLPEGTFGRAVADFMRARGLDPAAIPSEPATDEPSFVREHLYATHDVWHVATGFDTDVAGELAVQAFYSAQFDGELPRILLIGGLVNARLTKSEDWAPRLDAIARGWALGRRARPLFGVAWDDLWSVPLPEVRASLGLDANDSDVSSRAAESGAVQPPALTFAHAHAHPHA